ncbi:MAG: acyltransferase [Campylobacterales bacterium]|nr:acyltransferase [Campylobacterales bacterium]
MLFNRNPGLDLFRFMAIALVLLSHGRHFFSWYHVEGWNWWWLSVGGYLGVELFFVLSGFLIGSIMIQKLLFDPHPLHALKRFLIRRWLRTLPLYFLILAITVGVACVVDGVCHGYWGLHVLFLQNFHPQGINFFAVSWSLSVEEWFYLLTPIVLLLWLSLNKTPVMLLIALMAALVLINAARLLYVDAYPHLDWTAVRKQIFLRFDALLFGVLLAWIQHYRPRVFTLLGSKAALFIGATMLLGLVAWYYRLEQVGLDHDFFSKTLMFTVTSCALLPLLAAAFLHVHRQRPAIELGSKLSYGIYLIHLPIFLYGIERAKAFGEIGSTLLILWASLTLVLLLSWLLYRFYERPIMNLRDRFN